MSEMSSRELLDRSVGFATVSRDSNLDLIAFVRDYLQDSGWRVNCSTTPSGRKANLFATIGPRDRGGIVLSGHTDVVPVDGQAWEHESIPSDRAGRPAVRARHGGHEGLYRLRCWRRCRPFSTSH